MPAIDPKATRGYANCNPTNLDRSEPPWNSEIRDPNAVGPGPADFHGDAQRIRHDELTHGRFCVFPEAKWGIRAAAKNLQAYHHAGFNTYEKAIDRWAPPNENNTENYKRRIEQATGKPRTDQFNPTSALDMAPLLAGIIGVECGGNPYDGDEIEQGMLAAGIT